MSIVGKDRIVFGYSVCCSTILILGSHFANAAEPAEPQPTWWAAQPLVRPALPGVKHFERVLQPLDQFILTRLEERGLTFAPVADKPTWLRRVTFDLTGVPPTPDELQAFLDDAAPDAHERVVDRLLDSPRYGETWGRMWLDLVRFAETAGFNADPTRPLAYKYRDYVIRAFNKDMPYPQFVAEQLAGDEINPGSPEALAATGYNRMWPDESNASDVLLARQAALNDLTGNVGSAFLGISIGCAQCHDHKFDPLLQSDFYQLQAFFVGITLQDKRPVAAGSALDKFEKAQRAWVTETAPLRNELHAIETAGRRILGEIKRLKFPDEVLEAVDTHPSMRTPKQHQLAFWSERQIELKEADLPTVLDDFGRERRESLRKQLAEANKRQPKPPTEASVMAVCEITAQPPMTHLLATGSYEYPQEETPPGYPVILRRDENDVPKIVPPRANTSGRRTALAEWLTSPDHRLTWRVLANRIWQGHFGRGIVENANDFGFQTQPPSHPELLDWLATELVRVGGSWKMLHREIVLSATYRQQPFRKELATKLTANEDPGNSLYWHFPRQRLTAERIRDAWLMASGQLNEVMYGAGVRPELPPKFGGAASWKVSENPADRVRRSVYIFAKRNLPYPLLQVFDLPDMHESCGCRTQTTIAPQALMLINSELVLAAADQLSRRVRDEVQTADPQAAITQLWRITYGRDPRPDELSKSQEFLADQQALAANAGGDPETALQAAWTDLCHAVLNANEFLFVE
jgi:hypothetical protein